MGVQQTSAPIAYPLLSINIGKVAESLFRGKPAASGIEKGRVLGELKLGLSGLAGDEQADLVNHGGPDKAICVYPYRHYYYWEETLGQSLEFGAFGENFTVDEMIEEDVRIGDVFAIGEVKLEVSQPRVPCWKLAMRWKRDDLPVLVLDRGATGFYMRVVTPGVVMNGPLVLIHSDPEAPTVAEANRVMHHDKKDAEGIRRLLAERALADSWRQKLEARLANLDTSTLDKKPHE